MAARAAKDAAFGGMPGGTAFPVRVPGRSMLGMEGAPRRLPVLASGPHRRPTPTSALLYVDGGPRPRGTSFIPSFLSDEIASRDMISGIRLG